MKRAMVLVIGLVLGWMAVLQAQTTAPPRVSADAVREVAVGTLSAKLQARVNAVIAYMGTQPLPADGPDEGYFPGFTINIWAADFPDGAGREDKRWVLVEFNDTGRIIAAVDFNNRWRQKAVEAMNPVGG